MPRRISINTLNASTIDILNVIRQNATYDYQSSVPVVTQAHDIPKVGEIICGTPALANQFINALVNRIALVRAQSATFNNPYARLKKGYLEMGETIEEIFVNIAEVVEYSAEKAKARELGRSLPDVKSAFHVINWRVMYPITIQDDELQLAFLSMDGVRNLIAKIVDSIYTAAEYDEFLLFKYLMIKSISKGEFHPIAVTNDTSDSAVKFRATTNNLTFMSKKYNLFGVKTTTPKNRQAIFMSADFNAQFDVNVLASAFNMDKANFLAQLYLIDDWTTFDNERFETIRANSDGLEEVTASELALLGDVKAIIVDEEWFQIYDNKNKMTEKYVASGLYWNYFYHVWKTVSSSPFANAIVFVGSGATISYPATLTGKIDDKNVNDESVTMTLNFASATASLAPHNIEFIQTEALTALGIGVHPYGALLIPKSAFSKNIQIKAKIDDVTYTASANITHSSAVGATITLNKDA